MQFVQYKCVIIIVIIIMIIIMMMLMIIINIIIYCFKVTAFLNVNMFWVKPHPSSVQLNRTH